jgi:pre-mRNA-processing factor 40
LPYGDERPNGSRRRRADSDVESAGSTRVAKVRRTLASAN